MKIILKKKKEVDFLKKSRQIGVIHIQSTRNNTLITLTDSQGNTKYWTSAGSIGFKNSRKSTKYAAQAAAEKIISTAFKFKFFSVIIKMKGLGRGKQKSVRVLCKSGLKILKIEDRTPIPHNGCRPPKKRRV